MYTCQGVVRTLEQTSNLPQILIAEIQQEIAAEKQKEEVANANS